MRALTTWVGIMCLLWACTADRSNPVKDEADLQNHRPLKPHMPHPPAGETIVTVDIVLSWECSDPDGDLISYDVIFGKQNDEKLVVSDHPEKSYDPGVLEPGHFYGWQVIARDEHGSTITSDFWKFKTQ